MTLIRLYHNEYICICTFYIDLSLCRWYHIHHHNKQDSAPWSSGGQDGSVRTSVSLITPATCPYIHLSLAIKYTIYRQSVPTATIVLQHKCISRVFQDHELLTSNTAIGSWLIFLNKEAVFSQAAIWLIRQSKHFQWWFQSIYGTTIIHTTN